MYKPKYPKKNLRNPKHINPNPKDSDQRERELRGRERLRLEGEKELGHRAAWVCLGRARWSEADLKPPTPFSIFSLFLFLVFFFFLSLSLYRFFADVLVVPLWFVLIYKGYKSSLRDWIPCSRHMEKYAMSKVFRA